MLVHMQIAIKFDSQQKSKKMMGGGGRWFRFRFWICELERQFYEIIKLQKFPLVCLSVCLLFSLSVLLWSCQKYESTKIVNWVTKHHQ